MTTSTVKITKRERFETIAAMAKEMMNEGIGDYDFEGIVEFCEAEVEALANRAAKAKERAAAKRAEGDELQATVLAALSYNPQTRQEVFDQIDGGEDVTIAKVGYRLSALVKAGKAVKSEVVVEGEDGKSKKLSAYALIQ